MKQLSLFNALTQSVEPFTPTNPHDVKLYCCGPTVNNIPHLGHARTYVFMDVLRRILQHYMGYGLRLVMNVTDLAENITDSGLAHEYEKKFFKTMNLLNIETVNFTPRVTECLELATNLWKRCMTQKFAYFTRNLDIYFHSKAYLEKFGPAFPDTGKPNPEATLADDGKWDPCDFPVWKDSKQWIDAKGNQHTGIPSRHTACAAMAIFHFNDSIDLHLGSVDLQFPHHENEIALSRVYFKKKDWVRICLYTGILEMGGQKMSNSLQNVVTVEEMLAKGYSPLVIRYMFLKHPYQKPMCFREDQLKGAQHSYNRLMKNIGKMKFYQNQLAFHNTVEVLQESWERCNELSRLKKTVDEALMDNVNIPKALDLVEDYVQSFVLRFKKNMSYEWISYCLEYVLFLVDTCFGLMKHSSEYVIHESDELYPVFKKFRSGVREYALKAEEMQRETLLEMCDKVKEEVDRMGYDLQDQ